MCADTHAHRQCSLRINLQVHTPHAFFHYFLWFCRSFSRRSLLMPPSITSSALCHSFPRYTNTPSIWKREWFMQRIAPIAMVDPGRSGRTNVFGREGRKGRTMCKEEMEGERDNLEGERNGGKEMERQRQRSSILSREIFKASRILSLIAGISVDRKSSTSQCSHTFMPNQDSSRSRHFGGQALSRRNRQHLMASQTLCGGCSKFWAICTS